MHLLSSRTFRAFFDKPPYPTSLNIVLYPSHWQPPLTVPQQKRQPLPTKVQTVPHVHFFFPYNAVTQIHVSHVLLLAKPLHHPLIAIRFEFLYPSILLPNTGWIPDRMICSTLASFVFFSSFLYLSTIAVVHSLSALFVPMCTSMVPPFPLPIIVSTLSLSLSHALSLLPVNTLLSPLPCSIVSLSS